MSGPDVWGPHGWKFIHYITLGYPNNPTDDDKKKYYNFFHNLKFVIPCSICGAHFRENLEKTPITEDVLSNKQKLIEWGITMHNHVNQSIGKKTYTYEEGLKEILNNKTSCIVEENIKSKEGFSSNNNNILLTVLISIIIILILYIFIK